MKYAALLAPLVLLLGCGNTDVTDPTDDNVEVLTPEPTDAPTGNAGGRLSCMGKYEPAPVSGNALELTAYIRTLADPDANQTVPDTKIEAFTADGTLLGTTFSNPEKDGRMEVTVAVRSEGFVGYAVATSTAADYIPWRFRASVPVTSTDFSGWTWLATRDEANQLATSAGVTIDPAKGILVGVVHDCDGFGVENAVVQIAGSTDGIVFTEGFDLVTSRTFTSPTGRFVAVNVDPGDVTIKAFGRDLEGGKLKLLSKIDTTVVADTMSAVALQPRVKAK